MFKMSGFVGDTSKWSADALSFFLLPNQMLLDVKVV